MNQRVAGSIPDQKICLGCGSALQCGVHERQPHIDVSPHSFSLFSPLSKNKINKILKKKNSLLFLALVSSNCKFEFPKSLLSGEEDPELRNVGS